MKNDPTPEKRPRGRPRAFDSTRALDQALEVFWRLGYEGASIADLTEAMGITAPSLYAAFGSKAELYRQALERYRASQGASTPRALTEEPTARASVERLLREAARNFSSREHPRGCMISTAVLRCAEENQPVAEHVATLRAGALAALQARIEQGLAAGELPAGTDSKALARYCGAIIQGMSVQALDGASEAELLGVVDIAMLAWDKVAQKSSSPRKKPGPASQ
ncbi:TetR/AcrR family transcriptional regulator [Vitiosangium sp. GDMCC 1.1324]|uniref:TetR/AcrR family transcriptional regulator n=1 Tax=Vitiosangium sp. (strain GDMCC 1.1324) TaxID=2138576 RepID=UPI000D3A702D|nr:TetR/AcrR family transcriptional regulator [Vitiosangium sp. GDMCC 1.1324]PTL79477.1 TetR family transcriptional regulator [Vitiosangium sp. GDMCC 1.1324]